MIGYGAIAEEIVRCLDGLGEWAALLGVLGLPQRMPAVRSKAMGKFQAVAGLDGLLAARTAGLRRVLYTSIKPPVAWDGTPAETILTGLHRGERTVSER